MAKPEERWKFLNYLKYQNHVTISPIDSSEEVDKKVVYMKDLEKRKEAYGICGECFEPGTGDRWCKPCNAKRFKDNFKIWTSGNKDIDEFIQDSQINAVHYTKCLEWIPFENFQDVTYVTRGGFGKIYSAEWPEGYIQFWDIENQKWERHPYPVALKSLDNSSDISADFLNEIRSHLQIFFSNIVQCYGITQHPETKDYMMVLKYCVDGNLRDYLNNSKDYIDYEIKISHSFGIVRGLLDIHNAGKVHKDFHSGNILFMTNPFISDLGMCHPANGEVSKEGFFGVLPYMAPEVLRGYQYTKASDIYSFGIIMNELMSEKTPYNDTPHDHILAVKICKGFRPEIFEDTPKLFADLIMKCWDGKAENRPTAKELFQILNKWKDEMGIGRYYSNNDGSDKDNEDYLQVKECDKIRKNKFNNGSSKNKSNDDAQAHPQAIYTSRLLNFKNLPGPENSSDLSSVQHNSDDIQSTSASLISECFDCELSETDLNDDDIE